MFSVMCNNTIFSNSNSEDHQDPGNDWSSEEDLY